MDSVAKDVGGIGNITHMFICRLGGVDHNNLGDMVHQYVWLLYRLVYLFIQHNFCIFYDFIILRHIFL